VELGVAPSQVAAKGRLSKGLAGGSESGESSVSQETVEPATLKEPARRFDHYELVTGEDGNPVELSRSAPVFGVAG
jgi:hypothetical protein